MKIKPPTNCPSCSSDLVWRNNLLYCENGACPEKSSQKLEHFAKTLKIKGLGPASLKKLGISDIDELYQLTSEQLIELLGSEKLGEKLYSEIQNSKLVSLEVLLPAFSIPLIGKTASEKLSTVCESILDINKENCEKAGLGPKATESILEWLSRDFYPFYDGYLPFDFKFSKKTQAVQTKGVVCISGKLLSFKSKAEATKALNALGYEVKSSLTKQVTILVNESGIESSKTKQARDSGVTIVNNLNQLIGV